MVVHSNCFHARALLSTVSTIWFLNCSCYQLRQPAPRLSHIKPLPIHLAISELLILASWLPLGYQFYVAYVSVRYIVNDNRHYYIIAFLQLKVNPHPAMRRALIYRTSHNFPPANYRDESVYAYLLTDRTQILSMMRVSMPIY